MSEKKSTLMQKVQRFGGAMFTPVLFFAVFGIIVGFATLFKNNLVFGSLADPETTWYKVWDIIYNGANTVFKQMPLIFAIGLPVSLAKKQQARACLEIFVIYATFLYLTSSILQYWGPVFGVDLICRKNKRTCNNCQCKNIGYGNCWSTDHCRNCSLSS